MNKLNLNPVLIQDSTELAHKIAHNTIDSLQNKSTVAIERAICRILGINKGNLETQQPYSNIIVDYLKDKGLLQYGVLQFLSQQVAKGINLYDVPNLIMDKENLTIDINNLLNENDVIKILKPYTKEWKNAVKSHVLNREKRLKEYGDKKTWAYVIVATGNIHEDVKQAEQAVYSGADVIAVIRSSGQSLLDYVPLGETTEGYGGTYATKENFELMRKSLDKVGGKVGRYIRLCNYCSGLCMPEMSVLGSYCGLDVMLNDALYGILFRDINMMRTLTDQHFSRKILALSKIIINTGEDNYLTTADAVESAHTVLTSDFINQAMAHVSGLPDSQIGLGHAFEMNPEIKGGFLWELSQAQMTREIFPNCPIKYMPPTKFITGNIFKAGVQNTLFNIVGTVTNQPIQLLGMMTEGIHTPFPSDRAIALDNFNYVYNNLQGLADEIYFKDGGIIQKRADEVLNKAYELLKHVEAIGLFNSISEGVFANISRYENSGKGAEGVFDKRGGYINWEIIL